MTKDYAYDIISYKLIKGDEKMANTATVYRENLKVMGIKNEKKWLEKNTDGVTRKTGMGVKPIQVHIKGKTLYYMSYAEACYRIITEEI